MDKSRILDIFTPTESPLNHLPLHTKGSDAMPASQEGFPKGEPEALAAIQALGLRVSGPLPRVDNPLAGCSIAAETNISPLAAVACGFLSAADINPARGGVHWKSDVKGGIGGRPRDGQQRRSTLASQYAISCCGTSPQITHVMCNGMLAVTE
jgi:hypothetical protein